MTTKARIRCRCGLCVFCLLLTQDITTRTGTAAQRQAQQRVGLVGGHVMSATMVGVHSHRSRRDHRS